MQYLKNNIIILILLVAVGSVTYAQDTIKMERVESNVAEIDTSEVIDSSRFMEHKSFKGLRDREMSAFLKENDAESYAIFFRGETQRGMGKNMLTTGIVFAGAGVAAGVIWLLGWPVSLLSIFTLNGNIINWWGNNHIWFIRVGLSAIIIAQPFFVASIVLKTHGNALKRQAISNYENKYFKNTTSLNFNLYPNGFGVSLKF